MVCQITKEQPWSLLSKINREDLAEFVGPLRPSLQIMTT
jgi:hypothetical protein